MSEVITGVVKFAFGLISNKLRTYGAEKLEDADLTDQKLHGLIVRELKSSRNFMLFREKISVQVLAPCK